MYEIVKYSEHYVPGCPDDYYSLYSNEITCEEVIAYVATEKLAKSYIEYKTTTERGWAYMPRITYDYREASLPEIIDAAYVLYIGDSTKPYRLFFSEKEMNNWLEGKKRKYRIEQMH